MFQQLQTKLESRYSLQLHDHTVDKYQECGSCGFSLLHHQDACELSFAWLATAGSMCITAVWLMCSPSGQADTHFIDPHVSQKYPTCKQQCYALQMTMTTATGPNTTMDTAEATTVTPMATTTTMEDQLQLLQQLLVEALQLQQLLPAEQQATEQDAASIVKTTWMPLE